MTAEPIPRPLIVLGEEFRAMAETLETRMGETPFDTGAVFDIFDLVDEHMHILGDHVGAFCKEINEGLGGLTHEPDDHFRGVASRLNRELDSILDGYRNVWGLDPGQEDLEGWSLLVEIYEDTLRQIRDYLAEVVEFLDDPVAGVRKRGIPADGTGVVNLSLDMDPPRQLDRLARWLERRGRNLTAARHTAWAQENRRRAHREGLVLGSLIAFWMGKG